MKDLKKSWLKCCRAAGITGLNFHDLRHEASSRMLEAGWPLHYVQAVLSQADAKTNVRVSERDSAAPARLDAPVRVR